MPRCPRPVLIRVMVLFLLGCDGGGGNESVDAGPSSLGASCETGDQCGSGHCVDRVCCDTACDQLCNACGSDGACAPVVALTDPDDECSDAAACAAGTCDGAGGCALKAPGESCRAATGGCDVAETCNGVDDSCPPDAIALAASSCRATAGDCDVVETCDGSSAQCPTDGFATPGTICTGYVCAGTEAACPATCSADAGCAPVNVCVNNACTPGRRAFITANATTGAMNGLAGADQICQGNADGEPQIRGTYRAWLSDATGSPATRFTRSTVPYYLVTGQVLASSWTDLADGSLARRFNVEVHGTTVASNVPFTNTNIDGTTIDSALTASCSNWTSAANVAGAWFGWSETLGPQWTQNGNGGGGSQCNQNHRLFCFQQ